MDEERERDYSLLPQHMRSGARRYIEYGILPGGLMTEVIMNGLKGALGKADVINKAALFDILNFWYREAPISIWGSREAVNEYVRLKVRERGKIKMNIEQLTTQERVSLLRQKAADGTLTLEEMKEAIVFLRQGREAAAQAPARKAKTAKAQISSADLLNQLEGL